MLKEDYPKTYTVNDMDFTFRLMDASDREAILEMTQRLAEADLLFMRRDITQPSIVDEWIRDIEDGCAITILAEDADQIVAYGSIYFNQMFWSRHLGEIRVMVSQPYRNRGLGTRLIRNLVQFARELELEKVFVYTAASDKGAQRVVEGLGFRAEALLTDWVKTRDERSHDLVIMTTALADFQS